MGTDLTTLSLPPTPAANSGVPEPTDSKFGILTTPGEHYSPEHSLKKDESQDQHKRTPCAKLTYCYAQT